MLDLDGWLSTLGSWTHVDSCQARSTRTDSSSRPPAVHDSLLLSIERSSMACEFEVLLNRGQYPHGVEQAGIALDAISHLEHLLSVYIPTSDFSTANRYAAMRPIPVSASTLELIGLGQAISELTDGAFDLTAGKLSEVWGFSRRQGRVPTDTEIAAVLSAANSRHIVINAQGHVRYNHPATNMNPGGIGKGYALDVAAKILSSAGIGDFLLHGGRSSIAALGNRQRSDIEAGWMVALKHPWRMDDVLGTIRLVNAALGTSGSGKQFFHFEGRRYSHIIDPRTGRPSEGMMSTTVICSSAAVADALATAMFVMGAAKAAEFCEAHPQIGAILIFPDPKSGSMRITTHNLPQDTWIPESH